MDYDYHRDHQEEGGGEDEVFNTPQRSLNSITVDDGMNRTYARLQPMCQLSSPPKLLYTGKRIEDHFNKEDVYVLNSPESSRSSSLMVTSDLAGRSSKTTDPRKTLNTSILQIPLYSRYKMNTARFRLKPKKSTSTFWKKELRQRHNYRINFVSKKK